MALLPPSDEEGCLGGAGTEGETPPRGGEDTASAEPTPSLLDGACGESGLPVLLQAQERDDQRDDRDQRARDHQVLDRLSPAVSCQQAVGRAISVSAGYPWDGTDVGMVYRTAWPSHHT